LKNPASVCSPFIRPHVILFLVLLTASNACALVDENLTVDSWTYSLVRELDLRGFRLTEFGHERPASLADIAAALDVLARDMASGKIHPTQYERRLLEALNRELEVELRVRRSPDVVAAGLWGDGRLVTDGEGEDEWRGQCIAEAALRLGSRTTLYHRSWIDTRAGEDPAIVARAWKEDLTGVTDAAYLLRRSAHWRLLFGRERMDWGPGFRGGLIFSAGAPPLDMVKAELCVARFHGTAFAAVLDDYVGPYGDSSVRAARYLSGHRLAWRASPSLEISVSELIVYGGEGRLPEVRYLMPLFFFYGEQWNTGSDDNPLWAFDVSWRPRRGARLYGELLIDDLQYETEAEPNEIGYVVGGELADPPVLAWLGGTVLGFEYARINRWTYGQNKPWNRYLGHGVCMGHPLGPDADGLWARVIRPVTGWARLQMDLGRVRRGEGRIEDERSSVVPFSGRFPSGSVEVRTTLTLGLEVFPRANRWFFGEVGWARVENIEHEAGRDRNEWTAVVRCRVGFERFRVAR